MSAPTAISAAMAHNVCSECQGMFPTQAALGQHLIWHNQVRAVQASQPPLLRSSPLSQRFTIPPSPPPEPSPMPRPDGLAPGVVAYYDDARGFGFIKRTGPGASTSQVHFTRSVVASSSSSISKGLAVLFADRLGPKGFTATVVQAANSPPPPPVTFYAPLVAVARPTEPVESTYVPGIVVSYRAEGGIGTIAKLDASGGPDLFFHHAACDIKGPLPTPGERVLIVESMTNKGPTATVVRRISIPPDVAAAAAKPKTKKLKKTKAPPPLTLSQEALLAALTRAMTVVSSSSPKIATKPRKPAPVDHKPLTLKWYQKTIEELSSLGDEGPDSVVHSQRREQYVANGLAMLARTQPVEADHLRGIRDTATQSMLLLVALQDELHKAQQRELANALGEEEDAGASLFDFGDTRLPSPIRARSRPPVPEPEPELPRTAYCGICMEDAPIEDVFCVTGCDHTYCRGCIHPYIKGKLDEQDVTPKCPHGDCAAALSDGDLTLVLSPEEQEQYYRTCQDLAIASVPGLFQCLQPDCRGMGALAAADPHFVCPLCGAERCVQCNTREWHDGLTCAQRRQREQDSALHPEQLRTIYGNGGKVYQCGRCAFGPIEHQHCNNLATHHNEARGGARIDNACPRCRWFASDINQWPRWNGELAAPAAAAHQ